MAMPAGSMCRWSSCTRSRCRAARRHDNRESVPDLNSLKQLAAEAAAALVEDGMTVGLGSGSTAAFAVEALGKRVRAGLRISGIATSERTADQARGLGIPLAELAENTRIDLTIDGADEVE